MPNNLRATYRVQLHSEFSLDDAAALVDYLDMLGISHIFCSPYLQAAAGSTHGYDVVNPHQVNRELGGSEALARLSQALIQHEMGQVLDIVPNHMAVASENPWWQDVLENGQSSPYASYFDVEWDPPEARHSNAVLLPVLSDHYGRVLEDGHIKLVLTGEEFRIRYHEQAFPLDPRSLGKVLARAVPRSNSEDLAFIANAFSTLPLSTAADRVSSRRRKVDQTVLHRLLARLVCDDPVVARALHEAVEEINADPEALDALLEEQNYRLAYWRIASRELRYRRFFNINSLIGMQVEDPAVYVDMHALVLGWLRAGLLDGLRVDHPDGLRDPQGYFERLRADNPETWIVVEKILMPGEHLPSRWPVDGATGYDFIYEVSNLLVDPAGAEPLQEIYTRFSGHAADWRDLVREKKLLAADRLLGSELARLTALLLQVTENHRRYRDYVRAELRDALSELAADLPVYRTYARPADVKISPQDLHVISAAVSSAKQYRPDLDPLLFDFLGDLLCLRYPGELENELVIRFQQFTGPLMAKGVEDTAFYTDYRLISLNEVGGDPGQFGLPIKAFHTRIRSAQKSHPRRMLATSTHDTKRSEDVRARLHLLSEIPQDWAKAVSGWAQHNETYRPAGIPDRNDEWLFYQTLVGAWPLEKVRAQEFMEKACREAKRHTSWTEPNAEYERGVEHFVSSVLEDRVFCEDIEAFITRLVSPGRINSLTQTLLKLTAPGIPDIYQGTEIWNLSLVDPDNRRPVDYKLRRRLLASLDKITTAEILKREDEGLPKLWLIRQTLDLRTKHPKWFDPEAEYVPIETTGGHVAAFRRGAHLVVVVPRLLKPLLGMPKPFRLASWSAAVSSAQAWTDAQVTLPDGEWRDILTGEEQTGGARSAAEILAGFPVALLASE